MECVPVAGGDVVEDAAAWGGGGGWALGARVGADCGEEEDGGECEAKRPRARHDSIVSKYRKQHAECASY